MNTLEMEVAIIRYLDPIQNVVVNGLKNGLLKYEGDVVKLTPSGYATEIEIKVSNSDFDADFNKQHFHNSPLFKYFYYAVPVSMKEYVLQKLPKRAGLLIVSGCISERRESWYRVTEQSYTVSVAKEAQVNPLHRKWTVQEQNKLARLGCMRILGLKENLLRKEGKLKSVSYKQEAIQEEKERYMSAIQQILADHGRHYRHSYFYNYADTVYRRLKARKVNVKSVDNICDEFIMTGKLEIEK